MPFSATTQSAVYTSVVAWIHSSFYRSGVKFTILKGLVNRSGLGWNGWVVSNGTSAAGTCQLVLVSPLASILIFQMHVRLVKCCPVFLTTPLPTV